MTDTLTEEQARAAVTHERNVFAAHMVGQNAHGNTGGCYCDESAARWNAALDAYKAIIEERVRAEPLPLYIEPAREAKAREEAQGNG